MFCEGFVSDLLPVVNVKKCRECGELFVGPNEERMLAPGKYPVGICRDCDRKAARKPEEQH